MKRRRLMSEINVVPYVDVMLVLLVIFMVAAPLLTQGVEVKLPSSAASPVSTDRKPLVVTVDAGGKVYLQDETVSLDRLLQAVSTARQDQPDLQVLVRGDRDANYGRVIEIMARLQAAGIQDVGLLTESPEPASS
ncbi:protein TolR [Thermithiobacillus plumbiphilus]|uniref:Tol-Pal system protein TolR n=1 Tax=Thermithiobacillus plumbiphilus TaxID=1729899 RepID=A0ABU9D4J3_9PROT